MINKTLKVTLTFFILLLIVILFALVPGHLQIRKLVIEIPSLEYTEDLFLEQDSKTFPIDIHYVNTAQQTGPFGTLGHLGVLITWNDGKQFLIDTGMNPEEAQKFGATLELLGAGPTLTFGAIEEQLGGYIDAITGIGFTHLHSDHTAGISNICIALRSRNEQATIFQTNSQSSLQNTFTKQGQQLINNSDCEVALLGDELIKPVPGFEGLFAIEAGGHTPGSTVFITKLAGKTWILAGDLTNAMQDIHNNKDKGWIYSHLLVPEDTKLLEKWRLWLEQADQQDNISVLVAHDINAFKVSDLKAWQEP
jgi:glyoxylase-like metal-dependent hydrolase (beta-lactamase superfamily II)